MPPFAIELLATVVLYQGPHWQKPQPNSVPEFYIKVEVQGPLAPSSDPTKQNIAFIRYGEGFARQTILLKWPEERKDLGKRIKGLQGKWVLVTGRLEIGIPPEVRVD